MMFRIPRLGRFSFCLFLGLIAASRARSAPPGVQKVENAGLLFTDNRAGVTGTDCGYSIPLGDRTLWLFGDVFLLPPDAPFKNYVGALSNCALLVPKGSGAAPLRRYTFLTDPKTGLARYVLPPAPNEATNVRLWPFGGWHDRARKRACLFYAQIHTTGFGPFAFQTDGFGLACADTTAPEQIRFARLTAESGALLWWVNAPEASLFGQAVVANCPGDYLYVAGAQERAGHKWGKLARVPKDRVTDLRAYEYFAGANPAPVWSHDIRTAADVSGLDDFPSELSIAYNAYLNGYLAVHSIGISDRIRLSLAPQPWGPYRRFAEISAPRRALTQGFCYAGKEHPELAEERGRIIYVTYVDSSRYWLNLLKVTLLR